MAALGTGMGVAGGHKQLMVSLSGRESSYLFTQDPGFSPQNDMYSTGDGVGQLHLTLKTKHCQTAWYARLALSPPSYSCSSDQLFGILLHKTVVFPCFDSSQSHIYTSTDSWTFFHIPSYT